MKIGVLIPSTSKNRQWTNYKESYLYVNTLKTFLLTYDQEHEYIFYIGIDKRDRIYDNQHTKDQLIRFVSIMKNISIQFIYMDGINKGHLTVMWNKLFQKAYDEKCDYFFQCGDDIEFRTKGWINDCIKVLKNTKGIGLVGPINNNPRILTQSFVSRKHMELFGYYFPPEIINWFCDDWINEVYKCLKHFYPLNNHFCENIGGQPRYTINNKSCFFEDEHKRGIEKMREKCMKLVEKDVKRVDI
jgi:hypothetical protein